MDTPTSQTETQPSVPPPTPVSSPAAPDNSESTKTIVTILLLLFVTPIGVIVMWFWPKWKTWVKVLITLLCLIPFAIIFLAIMGTVALIAVNPSTQFAKANDTQRKNDISMIASAVIQYEADNNALPESLKSAPKDEPFPIQSTSPYAGTAFCQSLVPTYIAQLPFDPKDGTFKGCADFDTKYTLTVSLNGSSAAPTVTVSAPEAQLTKPLSTDNQFKQSP